MPLALAVAALAAGAAPPPHCALISPVAPDATAARRIAQAVLANVPHVRRPGYRLMVDAAPHDSGGWYAIEVPPNWRNMRGGGGLGMRIDRCTGAISELYYQR